ncbi:DUF2235 domain-containing protein [Rhodobacteraceae bacterium M385]|nr:DUF2235 domain-containing protein [Rhodobacteraceae bacterium M385]
MKRIVILCDGTWNHSDAKDPTNVVRLARAMAATGVDGVPQIPIYVEGVGSGRGVTAMARFTDRILGGAFGWGLMDNVIEAYRHLVFMHEPGDEIYIFGFSRGAFTARSLAGFVRSTGIVDRDRLHLLPEAIERYRRRDDDTTHPSSDESHAFRAKLSLRVVTSAAEAAYRAAQGMPEAPLINIAYLGVWDTVGALGVPNHLKLASLLNGGSYSFHDADLSSLVRAARHAIALDELRPSFAPTRWDNLDRLNAGRTKDVAPYQEKFFAGDHGSVGGGGDILDLSNITLEWIAAGAHAAGLALDPTRMDAIRAAQDPTGPLHNFSNPRPSIIQRLMRWRKVDRAGPMRLDEVHPAVHQRWTMEAKSAGFKPYRPGSLKRLEPELTAYHAPTMEGENPPRAIV